jgi:hypothetical protein
VDGIPDRTLVRSPALARSSRCTAWRSRSFRSLATLYARRSTSPAPKAEARSSAAVSSFRSRRYKSSTCGSAARGSSRFRNAFDDRRAITRDAGTILGLSSRRGASRADGIFYGASPRMVRGMLSRLR